MWARSHRSRVLRSNKSWCPFVIWDFQQAFTESFSARIDAETSFRICSRTFTHAGLPFLAGGPSEEDFEDFLTSFLETRDKQFDMKLAIMKVAGLGALWGKTWRKFSFCDQLWVPFNDCKVVLRLYWSDTLKFYTIACVTLEIDREVL